MQTSAKCVLKSVQSVVLRTSFSECHMTARAAALCKEKIFILDDGWPDSETGDCSVLWSYETIKIDLSKSNGFFIQSVIEKEVAKKLDLKYEEKRYIEREKERVDVKE